MTEAAAPERRFTSRLALLVALALVLRAWAPQRLGIDHFDEGVYAASASSIAAPDSFTGLYPGQEKFSPPVYFALGGALARLSGLEVDRALILLNALLGAATVALVGFVGRRWFGAAAGLATATLLAFNEFHIGLSRCALTDVAFALAHLGALFALIEALRSERFGAALAAGALVALAWNIKYHGWLACVGAGLALAPLLVARMRSHSAWRRPLALWCVAAGVAALGYAPWALYVEAQPGGYAGLAAYQSTMLRGGWSENLSRQLAQQLFFEGPFSAASLPLAVASTCLWAPKARVPRALGLALALGLIGSFLGGAGGVVALALAALPSLLGRARRLELPALALLAALVLWSVLTPFYHPYARLLLPLAVTAMLAAGVALQAFLIGDAATEQAPSPAPATAALGLAVLTFTAASFRDDASDPWRDARGVHRAALELTRRLPTHARVFVLGDPALAWYVKRAGFDETEVVPGPQCLERLEREQRETFVACGFYPRLTGAEQRLIEGAGAQLEPFEAAAAQVKDVRVLDDFRPAAARALLREERGDYEIRLYRYRPAQRDPLTR